MFVCVCMRVWLRFYSAMFEVLISCIRLSASYFVQVVVNQVEGQTCILICEVAHIPSITLFKSTFPSLCLP